MEENPKTDTPVISYIAINENEISSLGKINKLLIYFHR